MPIELLVGIVVVGLVVLVVGGALAVFIIRRTGPGRPTTPGKPAAPRASRASADAPAGADNASPTFLPTTPRGLGAGSFVTPIGGDSTPFETTLLAVSQSAEDPNFGLTIRFALQNRNPFSLLVAIPISHTVYLNCELEREFERDTSLRLSNHSVLDVQRKQTMFGPGKDHQVLFGPSEAKEFVIQFDKVARTFQTFDIEYSLEAPDCPYGRYRLRYDFPSRRFTRRFLLAQPPRPW